MFEYSFKNKTFWPVVFVIKFQLSKISVNTSKDHCYFEEFVTFLLTPSDFQAFRHPFYFASTNYPILWTFLHIWTFSNPIFIVWTFYSYGHFPIWTFSYSSNFYGHFITMDNLPYGFFTHRSQYEVLLGCIIL